MAKLLPSLFRIWGKANCNSKIHLFMQMSVGRLANVLWQTSSQRMQIDKLCYEKPHFMSVSCCQNCFSCCVVQCSGISPPIFQLLLYPFQMLHDFLLSLCVRVCVCLWSMCLPVYCSRKLSKLLSGSQFDLICLCHRSNSNNNNRKSNYS